MKNLIHSPSSTNPSNTIFNIGKQSQINIRIEHNPLCIDPHMLFGMAARMNNLRSFLFVSKVLGKHIPLNPYQALLAGTCLAQLFVEGESSSRLLEMVKGLSDGTDSQKYYSEMMNNRYTPQQPLIFIGFAETATALGHMIFDCFQSDAFYFHTTRESINNISSQIQFEEEHSHAKHHQCYLLDIEMLHYDYPVVLVDDEITTGKTALNFIRNIQKKYPRKEYYVLSLLDWRKESDIQAFNLLAIELGIEIHTISLIQGTMEFISTNKSNEVKSPIGIPVTNVGEEFITNIKVMHLNTPGKKLLYSTIDATSLINNAPFLLETGRFGITSDQKNDVDHLISYCEESIRPNMLSGNILCLGTGEFMYVPMRIAAELGESVFFHTTTRSPIHVVDQDDYAIRSGLKFPSPDNQNEFLYVYNIPQGFYEQLFIFFERDYNPQLIMPMINQFKTRGIQNITCIFLCESVHDWSGWK
jgi:hypothetical protein